MNPTSGIRRYCESNALSVVATTRRAGFFMGKADVIAIVEDDESVRRAASSLLRSFGYKVYTYSCGEDFLRSLYFNVTDCLITDLNLPTMSGMELCFRVREKEAAIPIILMSANRDTAGIEKIRRTGTCRVLTKPFDASCLLDLILSSLSSKVGRNNADP
jgi:FixJ family two-component response regulator